MRRAVFILFCPMMTFAQGVVNDTGNNSTGSKVRHVFRGGTLRAEIVHEKWCLTPFVYAHVVNLLGF